MTQTYETCRKNSRDFEKENYKGNPVNRRSSSTVHTICIEEEEEEKKTNWSYSILDSIEDHKSPFLESYVYSTI